MYQPSGIHSSGTHCEIIGIPKLSDPIEGLLTNTDAATEGSVRSFTYLKRIHSTYRSDVWFCKWDSALRAKENAPSLPPMALLGENDRIVAMKVIKLPHNVELSMSKELEVLRLLPLHPNIVTLYDYFFTPEDRNLYMVMGAQEGNLYHLFKARKGRHFAGGLVSSLLYQAALGLHHLHSNSYFHRDLRPENVLITTCGLFEYSPVPVSPEEALPTTALKEKDIFLTVKLCDFGLAKETNAIGPYTEYIAVRWYRAPEIMFFDPNYTKAVDMWAFGVIATEILNLTPLFPGTDQIDQITKICQILGNPSDRLYFDLHGSPINGGAWPAGIELARSVGFEFPSFVPRPFSSYFQSNTPKSLVNCIRQLLEYDPQRRLTSRDCVGHRYFAETVSQREIQ